MENTEFINELKETGKLLEVKRKYEKKEIKIEELSDEEKRKLIKLYKEQIITLHIEIEQNDKEIESYKKEILTKIKKRKNK